MPVTDGAVRPAGSAAAGLREHGDLHPRIWPLTACARADGEIAVGGVSLAEIAAGYGTPAYVLDEADVRQRCRGYRQAFGDAEIAYAGKAFLCRAMVRWVDEEGLSLDVCSEGELAVASSAGFPADRILLHGNAKTPGDLRAAMAYGVARIVLDSAGEIARIAALAQPLARPPQRVLIRVTRASTRTRTRRWPPASRTRNSASRSAPAPPPTRSGGSWLSRSSSWPACTATSARRSPARRRSRPPRAGWPASWRPFTPSTA
jgi:diaminopimelate decarboxylase